MGVFQELLLEDVVYVVDVVVQFASDSFQLRKELAEGFQATADRIEQGLLGFGAFLVQRCVFRLCHDFICVRLFDCAQRVRTDSNFRVRAHKFRLSSLQIGDNRFETIITGSTSGTASGIRSRWICGNCRTDKGEAQYSLELHGK